MCTFLALDVVAVQPIDGRTVAITGEGHVSHARFLEQVAAWRHTFASQPGCRWALFFDDALTFAAALFGAWHADKVVYLCGDNLPATLHGMREHVDGFVGDMDAAFQPLSPATRAAAPTVWPPLDRNRSRLYVHTSGSTGVPALIEKRLGQLSDEVAALEHQFSPLWSDAGPMPIVVQGTVSHQHIYGLLCRVLWPLASGRPFASRLFGHAELAEKLGESNSLLVTSPAHLKRLPVDLDWSDARRCLRAVFSSGGPLDDQGAEHTRSLLGVSPVEILGSSETGGIAFRMRRLVEDGALAWRPLPGVEWRIDGDLLEVRSPFLADAKWLRTNDRVMRDGESAFRLLGRADRIVKIEERRISLSALEGFIDDHPMVQEVRVLPLPGDRVELGAVLVLTEEGWRQLEELGRWRFAQTIRAALATVVDATLHPQRWRYVTSLPVNPQGKVTQQLLQSLFCALPEPTDAQYVPRPSFSKESQ